MDDSYRKLFREISEQNIKAAEEAKKLAKKKRVQMSIWRWFADNIVSIGALVVAIIALCRTA